MSFYTLKYYPGRNRKKRKEHDREIKKMQNRERVIPYEVQLRGETAPNNWRRLHGLKPLRRVREK